MGVGTNALHCNLILSLHASTLLTDDKLSSSPNRYLPDVPAGEGGRPYHLHIHMLIFVYFRHLKRVHFAGCLTDVRAKQLPLTACRGGSYQETLAHSLVQLPFSSLVPSLIRFPLQVRSRADRRGHR